ncbi:MAG TPA: acetyl-CoA C-acyltransferase [Burkholderiales bacterium]|nr:acetyl-CoA C-acyltransferase [Burkholderiales bacterium]
MTREVYIVAAKRSALTKAKKGSFANTRPDDLLAQLMQKTVASSGVVPEDIGDVIIGCAFPEAEQGLNVARVAAQLAGLPDSVPGMTINRYCSSGLNAIAIAANRIQAGEIEVAIAGGVESMSMIPMGGNDFSVSPAVFQNEHVGLAYGMGITAEKVAEKWQVSRQAQDEFATASNRKADAAQKAGFFAEEITPIEISSKKADEKTGEIIRTIKVVDSDEGIRADTTLEGLAKLKPAFAAAGSVTPGNSSQMTDGAGVLVLVSGEYLKQHGLKALGKFHGFAVSGVAAEIMGIGPIKAIPQLIKQQGLELKDIDWIELNEAFAAQSLAVINELGLDPSKVNPYGGAIALGHPLGATGAVLSVRVLHGLRRTQKKYGVVSMCIGAGMGAAGLFEVC